MRTQNLVLGVGVLTACFSSHAGFVESGLAYEKGAYEAAYKECEKEALNGDPNCQYEVGFLYKEGQGVPQDYKQAADWFRKAAEQGHAKSQNNLGLLYDKGQGVPQDYKQAIEWYRKAADQGNEWAQFNLGLMYYSGLGTTQDYKQAAEWFRKVGRLLNKEMPVALKTAWTDCEPKTKGNRKANKP